MARVQHLICSFHRFFNLKNVFKNVTKILNVFITPFSVIHSCQPKFYFMTQNFFLSGAHNEIIQQDIIMCMSLSRFLFYTVNACLNLNQKWTQNLMLTCNLWNNNNTNNNNNDKENVEANENYKSDMYSIFVFLVIS